MQGEVSPGKGFSLGDYSLENWAWHLLGVTSVLKAPIQVTVVLRRRKHFSYTSLLLFLEVDNESMKTD